MGLQRIRLRVSVECCTRPRVWSENEAGAMVVAEERARVWGTALTPGVCPVGTIKAHGQVVLGGWRMRYFLTRDVR